MLHSGHLPFRIHAITLRVCLDLDWRLTVHCPHCSTGSDIVLSRVVARSPGLAGRPIGELLEAGAFKCHKTRPGKSCNGVLAHRAAVRWMDVGILRTLACWEVYDLSGSRSARLQAPTAD